MKLVFFGTPEWATPSLRALHGAGHEIAAVVTAQDRPVKRSRKPMPSAVKRCAEELRIPLLQPPSLRGLSHREPITRLAADAFVVVAYGRILPGRLLDHPQHGAINVHFSLLPRHRGASPVQHAILAGDSTTGVTTMRMDRGLDTGPILMQAEQAIGSRQTADQLGTELAELGAGLIVETMKRLHEGELTPQVQNDAAATLAPLLKKEDGLVHWSSPASTIDRQVRAFSRWPSTIALGPRGTLRLLSVEPIESDRSQEQEPGTLIDRDGDAIVVACGGRSLLRVERVQPAGSRAMTAGAALNGGYISIAQPLEDGRLT